jgi:lipopolysaccharide export LptBFGC system permease protein LptF
MDKLFTTIQNKFLNINKNSNQKSLLQQQQISQQNINELLEKSAEAITCGPTCQKLKVSDELKQKYLNAETNLQTAPINLEQTKKNYYVYTEGRPYYDNMKEEELKTKATTITELLAENFNGELSSALTMNTYLNTALTNSQYTKDLLNVYLEKNQELKLQLRNSHGDILTNDRKTYYETEALQTLNLWYRLFWYIYYLLVLMLVIAFVLSPSELTIIKKVIIGILFILYPYYVYYIVVFVTWIWNLIVSRIPKNVYNNL